MEAPAAAEAKYQSALASRHCQNSDVLTLFSEEHKVLTWRQLWCWLAEAQFDLGLDTISQEQVFICI